MQRLEVSGAVRPIYGSLGIKRLRSRVTDNNKLTKWSRVLLEKISVPRPAKKFPHYMETNISSPCSQQQEIFLYPKSH